MTAKEMKRKRENDVLIENLELPQKKKYQNLLQFSPNGRLRNPS